jgi:phosphoribosyl 1,2-cyclic phosphate phosphodiesterase
MPTWEIIITGCGTSHGNPPWGYPALWSEDARDLRRRSGAILRGPAGQVLLIDVGPDLAWQLRDPLLSWDGRTYPRDCITGCDAVLLTHDHADHANGINDLRHLNRLMQGRSIPLYGHAEHLHALTSAFPYCFGIRDEVYFLGSPALLPVPVSSGSTCTIAGLAVTALTMSHGPAGHTTGYRCGGMAYLTDLKHLPDQAAAALTGLELLVLDMLREQPHPTHLCWAEAQEIIARLAPKRTVLTHMGHEVRYREWEHRLPAGVTMAVDGLRCPFTAEEG